MFEQSLTLSHLNIQMQVYKCWPGMSLQNGDVALIDIVLNVHMWSYHKSRIQT